MADNLILIGMPAVGKSTVGVLLAKRLGFTFVDSDLLIQTGEGRRLKQLIEVLGAASFCDLEADYIRRLNSERAVIATGGSVVYRAAAMAHLASMGRIVFLDIDAVALAARLSQLDERGVVHASGQGFDALYAERQPLYRQYAQWTIPASDLTPDQVVQAILAIMDRDPALRVFI